jgi:hypothetical protein
MTAIERMQSLVKTLPEKDRKLAYKFIDKRQFESLYELVNSAIYKARKAHKEQLEDIEYLDVAEMSVLQSEVINYIDRMGYNDYLEDEEF